MSKEREQMNLVLAKAGWELGEITKHGPLHIKYNITRIADGRSAHVLQDLPELLLLDIRSDDLPALMKEAGLEINPFVALRLLLLARSVNKKHPLPEGT